MHTQRGIDWECEPGLPFIRGCVWQLWLTVQTGLRIKNTHQHPRAQTRPKYTPRHVFSTVHRTPEKTHALVQKCANTHTVFALLLRHVSGTCQINQTAAKLRLLCLANFSKLWWHMCSRDATIWPDSFYQIWGAIFCKSDQVTLAILCSII